MVEIKEVKAKMVLSVRQAVLWPDKPLSYVALEADDEGTHYALFVDGVMVTVLSVFFKDDQAQFRKFATLEAYRGCGYGSQIFEHMLICLAGHGIKRIWCNARLEATDFYSRYGFSIKEGATFYKEEVAYTIMEKLLD